jgi:hypothetical protein
MWACPKGQYWGPSCSVCTLMICPLSLSVLGHEVQMSADDTVIYVHAKSKQAAQGLYCIGPYYKVAE